MEDLGDQNALINEGALICPHKPWKMKFALIALIFSENLDFALIKIYIYALILIFNL